MSSEDFQEQLQGLISVYKIPLILGLIGVVLVIVGVGLFFRTKKTAIEFTTDSATSSGSMRDVIVDVAGAVNDPGVYRLTGDIRVADVLAAAGSLSDEADEDWVSKNINLAAKVSDGVKIYIPTVGDSPPDGGAAIGVSNTAGVTSTKGKININTASASELDTLYGVGPATAQKIIDNRPYNRIEELVEKKAVWQSTFDKIKDQITVF